MNLWLWILIFSLIGGVFSLLGGVCMLFWQGKTKDRVIDLTSFAAGVLIAISILDLLPEAFAVGEAKMVSWAVFWGVIVLFLLEKTSVWFHHHHEPHGRTPEIVGVFLGDTLHNFIDGVAIGAAFLINIPTGVATAVAVGMHELPQEIADFSLYIRAGFSKRRTISLNLLSSLATLVGSLGIYIFGDVFKGWEVYILALTAGMFLYIGLADLLPELHDIDRGRGIKRELFFFFLGVTLSYLSMILVGEGAR